MRIVSMTEAMPYAGHAERTQGSLEPGKRADFILVGARRVFSASSAD